MLCAAVALALAVSNCSFPDYVTSPGIAGLGGGTGVAGGASATGGVSGGAGGGDHDGGVDDAGSGGDTGGAGTSGGGGSGGEAGAAGGVGGEPCLFPTPMTYPAHCFNRSLGDGETGIDCGGSECAPCSSTQSCVHDSDCVSQQCGSDKTCIPLISLTYLPIDIGAMTRTPKFRLNLTYLDTTSMPLSDLTIRYYYNHNDVAEPIGLDSQATIDPGNSQTDISNKVLASLHRFPLGPVQNGIRTDSYLEIAFDKTQTVTTGTKFVITQAIVAGSPEPLFDQHSHYSFVKSGTAVPNEAIVVYRAGERIWGSEPPLALFPECAFAVGVNMNGPQLTVGGESLLAESDASFAFSGGALYSNSANPVPTTDLNTASLLGTARSLNTGDSATWSVPSGKYWAYAWLTSSMSSDNGTLVIGQSVADEFVRPTSGPGVRWGLLGPYRVDVVANTLKFTVDGTVHLAGVKLYAIDRQSDPSAQPQTR